MAEETQSELDGMPDSAPILRVNGDTVSETLDEFGVDDWVTITGRGIVKKVGREHVGKTGKRRFVQVHVMDITATKVFIDD